MNFKKENGAFACASGYGHQSGMTMYEWYIGMALQGTLASPNLNTTNTEEISKNVILIVDSLTKELEKRNEDNG